MERVHKFIINANASEDFTSQSATNAMQLQILVSTQLGKSYSHEITSDSTCQAVHIVENRNKMELTLAMDINCQAHCA